MNLQAPFGWGMKSLKEDRNAIPGSDVFGDGKITKGFVPTLNPSVYANTSPSFNELAKYENGVRNFIQSKNIQTTPLIDGNTGKLSDFYNMNGVMSGKHCSNEYLTADSQVPVPVEYKKNLYIEMAGTVLHNVPDMVMSVFFSDENIEHMRNIIISKVKELTAKSNATGDNMGIDIQKPDISELFNFMIQKYVNYINYNGSICFVKLKNNTDIRAEISKLNSAVLQDYVSKLVSQINMYIYYYKDASRMPEQIEVPKYTSMKGSRSLEYNTGFYSGNSLGIAQFNVMNN